MKTNNHTLTLLENGIHFSTLTNMSERQIKVLAERFKKKETNEITMVSSSDSTTQSKLQSEKKPYEVYEKTEMGEDSTFNIVKDPDATEDGMPTTESELKEKFESKSQQGLFWAKCNNSKGKEKTKWCKMAKEFSDSTTKKEYKDMPEKKNPEKTVKYKKSTQKENYEKVLEDRILEMVQKNINPRITKGDLKKNISERSESMMLKNPKKNTMFSKNEGMEMKRPIVRMSSMGENTKEKQRTVTPGIKTPPKRRNNPHKDPNPGVKENPKAGMEKQKNDFMNIIKQALNV
jgi:hypothetical protein